MAQSNCVRCQHTSFELKPIELRNADYAFNAVQCAKCGGVVGVVDYLNNGHALKQIKEKLGIK